MCEALHLPVQSGSDTMLRRMGRQYTIEHYLERLGPDPRGGARDRALDRRHRRLLRRDRGRVRGDARAARGRPLRPGVRGGLQRAARDARDPPRRRRPRGREAAPPQSSCSRSRRRSASSATGPGSGGRPRCWSTRSFRPEHHDHDEDEAAGTARVARRLRATCPTGRATWPAGRARTSSSTSPARPTSSGGSSTSGRPRRPVRAPREARLSAPEPASLAPLVVIGGPTATGKTALAIALAERLIAAGSPGRDRSPRTRARCTAAWTSGRPRRRPRSACGSSTTASTSSIPTSRLRGRVPRARARGAGVARGARRRRDPRRRHRLLAAGRHWRASTRTRCRRTRRSARRARGAIWRATACDALADAAGGAGAEPRRADRPAQPAPRRAGPRDRDAPRRRAAARRPSATRRPSSALQLALEPAEHRRRIAPRARGPVRRRASSRRRAPCASASTRRCRAFSRDRLPRELGVLDGELTLEAAIELDAQRQRPVRPAPADLVPSRADRSRSSTPPRDPHAGRRRSPATASSTGWRATPGPPVSWRRHEPPQTDRPRAARREGLPRRRRHRRRRGLVRRGQPDRARRAGGHGGRRRRWRRVAEPPPRRPELVRGQGQGRGAGSRRSSETGFDVLVADDELSPAPAEEPREPAQRQGHRPQPADPRHLRAARPDPRGPPPGRARPARVPAARA